MARSHNRARIVTIEARVVIVGAGIGGAVLALELGSRGHQVVVLEREATPRRIVRPEVLWNLTLSALDRFGLGQRIREEASVRLSEINIGGLLRMQATDFAAAGTEAFSTDPQMTRAFILAAAQATGHVEVQRGVEVSSCLMDGAVTRGVAGVRGGERIEVCADLTVGDDGVHSFVRKSVGIPITLQTFPIDFITAGVPWPAMMPAGRCSVFLNRKAFRDGIPAVALIPWPKGEGVLLIPLPPARADRVLDGTATEFWGAVAQAVPTADLSRQSVEFPRDFVRVTRPFGHASSYVGDGVALIGDAAHPMTPAGGQGANASIWDAIALAEVADEALRSGNPSRERLVAYETRRRPINGRSVAISGTALRSFRMGSALPLSIIVPLVLRSLQHLVWPKRAILRRFSGTFADR